MKVSELIALLAEQDPEAEVATEGCDCIGAAGGVSLLNRRVLIERESDEFDAEEA